MNKLKRYILESYRFFKWCCYFLLKGIFTSLPKSQKESKSVFILGNGPSLIADIENHIDELKKYDLMMVNQALTSEIAFLLKPKYYVLMDSTYWSFKYLELENVDKNFLTWWKSEVKKLEKALEKVDWDMLLFVPHQVYMIRDHNSVKINNPCIKIVEYNLIRVHTFKKIEKFLFSNNMAVPSYNNVLISAICCCLSMKYQTIYMLGADSNWHKQINVDEDNRVFFNEMHFYRKEDKKNYGLYHASIYFRTIYDVLFSYEKFANLGFEIYNLTSESMIDAFPRNKLENILRDKKQQ